MNTFNPVGFEGGGNTLKPLRSPVKVEHLKVYLNHRIARSLSHLVKLMKDFDSSGVQFKSLQEPFIDTTSAHGKFVFTLFGAVAQLERDILVERTRAGLQSSRRRGVKMGRKPGLSEAAKQKAIVAERYYRDNKLQITDIMRLIDVRSKRTLYKYLAYQGRRNCKNCNKLFWDTGQPLREVYCPNHIQSIKPTGKK